MSGMQTPRDRSPEARWSPPLLAEGFSPVPNLFLARYSEAGIKSVDAMLVVQIQSFRWDERLPFPTGSQLAARMGTSERALRLALKRLETAGLKRVPSGRRVEYDFSELFQRVVNASATGA